MNNAIRVDASRCRPNWRKVIVLDGVRYCAKCGRELSVTTGKKRLKVKHVGFWSTYGGC